MSDSAPKKATNKSRATPAVAIVLAEFVLAPPTSEEARLVHAWLEEELSQIFEGK